MCSLGKGFNTNSSAARRDARGTFLVYSETKVLRTLSCCRLVASGRVRSSHTNRAFCSCYGKHAVFENIRSIFEKTGSLSKGCDPHCSVACRDARGTFVLYFEATVLRTLSFWRLVPSRKVRPSRTTRACCSFYENISSVSKYLVDFWKKTKTCFLSTGFNPNSSAAFHDVRDTFVCILRRESFANVELLTFSGLAKSATLTHNTCILVFLFKDIKFLNICVQFLNEK
jgi:hypothetical protein